MPVQTPHIPQPTAQAQPPVLDFSAQRIVINRATFVNSGNVTGLEPSQGLYNPTDAQFGADPTGNTDSTTAIQTCIAAASTAGTGVGFPAGTFLISGILTIPQNFVLLGVPRLTIIKQATNANLPAMMQTNNCTNGILTSFTEWNNFTTDGIIWNANGTNQAGWTSSSPQCALVLYGANITVGPNTKIVNGGCSAASNNQVPTGLLIGSSVENPANGAHLRAAGVQFENCYGVASWLTNAKAGFSNPAGASNTYGNPGMSCMDYQSFHYCRHGLYIEDRCNGFTAIGIQYFGDSNFYQTAGGNAVSILYGKNGALSVQAKYCSAALAITGGTPGASGSWQTAENIVYDVRAESCALAAVRLVGTPAYSGTLNGALPAGSTSIPVTTVANATSVCGNAWLLIVDAVNGSEWVQASGPIAAGSIPLVAATQLNHANADTIATDTGMRHCFGRAIVQNCGGTGDNAGAYFQAAQDCVLDLIAYDTAQYGAPLGEYASGVVQYYGAKITASTRVTVRGDTLGNRDTGFYDDGTNTDCECVGRVGSINDDGTRQLVSALRYAPQAGPSVFSGTGAPSNALGKAGDQYIRKDGTVGVDGPGTTLYSNTGGAWQAGRVKAIGRPTFNGDGATTTFSALHGLGASPNHAAVTLFAAPATAAAGGWVYSWDAMHVSVVFNVAPAVGTNNVAFDYQAWL